MKRKIIYIIVLSIFIFTCTNRNKEGSLFPTVNKSGRIVSIDTLILDTINLEKIQYSLDGFLQIYSNNLSLIDKRFGWIYNFDITGKLISRNLGQGRGPGEIDAGYIEGHTVLKNGDHVFIGSSWDVHILDKDWDYIKRFTMDWHSSTPNIESNTNPDPLDPIVYTLDYGNFKLLSDSKKNAYIQIYSEHPYFNGMVSKSYYENGRILLKLDLLKGDVSGLLGRRSPEYLKYEFLPQHATFSFDIDSNDNFYISHEIDSLIYVYDHEFKPLYSFGYRGKDMNTNYSEISSFNVKEFRRLYFEDKPKRGYYKDITIFEDPGNLLFRNYSKGSQSEFDGLQIYRNNTLIGDVNVPKGFKVVGYISPYFYSDVFIDEDLNKLSVLRFNLLEESSNSSKTIQRPRLTFKTEIIDVGQISQDTSIVAKYTFVNEGDTTLLIEYVKPDFICTSYKLSSNSIETGGEGFLELKFNSKGKIGEQKIYTIIKSNSEEKFRRLLLKAYIK